MKQVVLASTSPYRKALMLRLGIPFVTARPEVDEEAYKARIADPVALVQALSRAKAEAVAAAHPGAVVIGSDQVAEIDGEVLGKPHTEARAVAQLMRFSGRTHRLVTGLAVWDGAAGCWHESVNETRLVARPYSEDFARRYVERERPLDCAGSYMFERAGITLFERVETNDPTAIEGLPLTELVRALLACDCALLCDDLPQTVPLTT
jgi:septum formation protein